jgi:RsiW-degrading membrane proteinase PrsW (M82 family)
MPISVTCSSCGQRLKAKDTLAGRVVPCPKCATPLHITQPEDDAAPYALGDEPPPTPYIPSPHEEAAAAEEAAREAAEEQAETREERAPARPTVQRKKPIPITAPSEDAPEPSRPTVRRKQAPATLPPLSAKEPPLWLRHLHWLLVLALLPLAVVLLRGGETEDFERRLEETREKLNEEQQERVERALDESESTPGKSDEDRLFDALPKRRVAGAFLPHDTWAHWIFGLLTALVFMSYFLLLSTHDTAEPVHILGVGFFTATIGVGFLLLVQAIAFSRVVLPCGLLWILYLIRFSYVAALHPANGFMLSFFGFTFGVGLCEEVVKAAPLIWYYRQPRNQSWRGAFLWGLSSGAGFGIAEAIIYSAEHYNGIEPARIYLVRFISCVALHALWTGSVGIMINQNQGLIQQARDHWYEYIPPILFFVGVPMVLHGLYDTLLKQEKNAAALGVALLSFGFLAFQISRLHGADDQEANEEMLREYARRRKAVS